MNNPVPSPAKTLQRLYLTLFLRGRTSRGLNRSEVPASIGRKLLGTLAIYLLVGMVAFTYTKAPSFVLSFYLHGMSLFFLGMFIAASAGEILFNKEEAEILLHRPVDSRTLLWSKVAVMVRISLWLAFAFNIGGLIVGSFGPNGSLLFAPVHLLSTAMGALFCTSSVVLLYQICLRWFGRERLDNIMTTTQVILMVAMVVGSQLGQFVIPALGSIGNPAGKWWLFLLPPAWFAGLNEVLTGRAGVSSYFHGGIGIGVTALVAFLAFKVMADTYEEGLQTLAESRPRKVRDRSCRGLVEKLMDLPPLSWLLRDPVTRASFRLSSAYLLRDRDMKLRLYPGLAPVMVMPAVFLVQGISGKGSEIGVAFSGGYLGLLPFMAMNLLQYSQNWQAADLYRLAPVQGPAPFIRGATWAVCTLLVMPTLLLLVIAVGFLSKEPEHAFLLLPGLIALPVYALIPGAIEKAVPLSKPTEEAKSAMRGAVIFILMISALALPGIGMAVRSQGFYWQFLLLESVFAAAACLGLNAVISRKAWDPLE